MNSNPLRYFTIPFRVSRHYGRLHHARSEPGSNQYKSSAVCLAMCYWSTNVDRSHRMFATHASDLYRLERRSLKQMIFPRVLHIKIHSRDLWSSTPCEDDVSLFLGTGQKSTPQHGSIIHDAWGKFPSAIRDLMISYTKYSRTFYLDE